MVASAVADVEKLKPVLRKGDDFHKVLLGAALRKSLQEDIKAVDQIATEAEKVLQTLGTLTTEGRKLAVKP